MDNSLDYFVQSLHGTVAVGLPGYEHAFTGAPHEAGDGEGGRGLHHGAPHGVLALVASQGELPPVA